MKRFLMAAIVLVGLIFSAQAQKTYVVAFDCTKSMNHPTGDYSRDGKDVSVLWEPAKENIRSLFEQAENNDVFHIVLFQMTPLKVIHGQKSTLTWKSIESEMEKAITHGGNTCIYNAWMEASKYFTDDCDFYFITDGNEDHDDNGKIDSDEQEHINAICRMISAFCEKGYNGFYTNLRESKNAKINNQITDTIKKSCFCSSIAGNINPKNISLNQADLDKHGKTFNMTFVAVDKGCDVNVSSINAEIINDASGEYLKNASEYFKVSASDIENGKLSLTIKTTNKDVPKNQINDYTCKFKVKISSMSKKTIFPQIINVTVKYRFERIAYLPGDELEGESSYHPAFFIESIVDLFPECDLLSEHNPDTIKFDLKKMMEDKPLFNDEAVKKNSSYKLKLVPVRDKDKKAQFFVLKNGETCDDNIIEVNSNSDDALCVSIVFQNSSEEGDFKFKIVPFECDKLDKINECTKVEEASIPVCLEFERKSNPLSVLVILIIIIIVVILISRIVFVRLPRRRLNTQLIKIINGNADLLIRLDNCTKGVLTSSKYKQSFISVLFNGKYSVKKEANLNKDIFIKYAGNDLRGNRYLRLYSKGKYKLDKKEDISSIELKRNANRQYELTDMNDKILLTIKYI